MNDRERGFLLLTSHLGYPERKVLTAAQLRALALRVRERKPEAEGRELTEKDLTELDYPEEAARQIVTLLSQESLLDDYLARGEAWGCVPLTRVSPGYPLLLRQRLGLDSPGCLWAKGDLSILNTPTLSLVGSRELREPNRAFARRVGELAAERGITLVSGNARGADREAQDACRKAGGRVISIVADSLDKYPGRNRLFLSEEDFDEPFSAQRALSRNRCIHALGTMVLVDQTLIDGQAIALEGGVAHGDHLAATLVTQSVKNLVYAQPALRHHAGADGHRQQGDERHTAQGV